MDWLWAGGIIAALTAGWGQIKTLWAQVSSRVVVRIILEPSLVDAFLVYANDNFKAVRIGPQNYIGSWMFIRSVGRIQLVAWKLIGNLGTVYLKGRRPLWISPKERNKETPAEFVAVHPDMLFISFIRGTFDADALISEAVRYYNQIRDGASSVNKRHYVRRIYGLSKKRAMSRSSDTESKSPESVSDNCFDYRGHSPLAYKRDDIGVMDNRIGLEALALSDAAIEAVIEARRWKESESWYKNHLLSWRRGWQLNGKPGNGKTALVRALAEELDLPVYIYDLASLANDEFQAAWKEMLAAVPCMALIEDIDGVFDGRKTLVGDLTFDCLLNCIDGIERADGLFTIVTTNNVDRLDSALGISDEKGNSTRPGRVDRVLFMDNPSCDGRLKIAHRILAEYPDAWERVVREGDGDTGAQFTERCASLALKWYWENNT